MTNQKYQQALKKAVAEKLAKKTKKDALNAVHREATKVYLEVASEYAPKLKSWLQTVVDEKKEDMETLGEMVIYDVVTPYENEDFKIGAKMLFIPLDSPSIDMMKISYYGDWEGTDVELEEQVFQHLSTASMLALISRRDGPMIGIETMVASIPNSSAQREHPTFKDYPTEKISEDTLRQNLTSFLAWLMEDELCLQTYLEIEAQQQDSGGFDGS